MSTRTPGTPEQVDAAVARLRDLLGARHVVTGDDLQTYCRDTTPWLRRCAAVALPGSTDEVAQVVRVAAEQGLPVWPFSKGKNWGYGTTMAFRDGALILMLDRLNRMGLVPIFYDKEDRAEEERAQALYDELVQVVVQAGFQQYRTSVACSDRILGCNPAWQHLLDSLKAAVDPGNLLAPGRYGIGLDGAAGESHGQP